MSKYNGERFVMYDCNMYTRVGECKVFDLKVGDIDEYDLDKLYDIHEKYGINIYGLDLYDRNYSDNVEPDDFFLCVGENKGNFIVKTGLVHTSESTGYIHVEVFEKLKGKVFDYKIDYKDACIKFAEDEMKSNQDYDDDDFDEIVESNFEEIRVEIYIKAGIIRVLIEQALIDSCNYRGCTPVCNYVTELDLVSRDKKLVLSSEVSYKISTEDLDKKVVSWR